MSGNKGKKSSQKPKEISDKELAKAIEDFGNQYRMYRESISVEHLARSTQPEPVELPPSFDYPHIGTIKAQE